MPDKYKLILVDDEPWALSGLAEIIDWEEEGFTIVAQCECGADAIRAAMQFRPDAVITDIRMPGMSGIQLIRKLQKMLPIQCVVVSAYSDFEVARDAIRLSAAHYILKPFSAADVRDATALLRKKLDATERRVSQPLSSIVIDAENPAFPPPPVGSSSCYLLLSESPIFLVEQPDSPYRQPIQIGRHFGLLTNKAPDMPLPDIGISMPETDFSNARWMIRTAIASLECGFTFAQTSANGKSQLSAADIQLYLAEHIGEEITLKTLASHFYLTETYLCDLFKKQTNETILGFLRRIRMHKAKRLLEKSHMTLREVAFQCGYSDYSYFGRHFKAEVGITPDLYRKEKRNS